MTTDSGSTVPEGAPVSADVPVDEPVAPAAVQPPTPEAPAWGTPALPAAPEAPAAPAAPAVPAAPTAPEAPAAPAAAAYGVPEAPETPAAPGTPVAEFPYAPFPEVPAPPPVDAAPPAAPVAPAVPPAPVAPPAAIAPPPVAAPAVPAAPVAAPAAPVAPPVAFASPDPVDVPATPELASAVPAPDTVATGLSGAGSSTSELAPDQAFPYGAPPGGDGRGGSRYVPYVVAVVVLGLVVAAAFAAMRGPLKPGRDAELLADRRQEALNQARQLALNIGTLNHQRLDEDLRKIAESTTGKARAEFDEKILKNEAYKKLVRDNQAQLTTTIVRIGLEPCGSEDKACRRGDSAVALVFLDQESKNKLRPTPRVDRNRVALTLVRQGDKWLISEVQVL